MTGGQTERHTCGGGGGGGGVTDRLVRILEVIV
jgi:hypothetical protein